MKENRYFQMIYLLLDKGQMTAPELADYFEVSIRTIYRDIDILSSAGIPIYATQGKGGGIAIQDSYVLKKSLLSEQEQKQILMALQGIRVLEDEQINMLLSKLSGVFQRQQGNCWKSIFQHGQKVVRENIIFNYCKAPYGKAESFPFLITAEKVNKPNGLLNRISLFSRPLTGICMVTARCVRIFDSSN